MDGHLSRHLHGKTINVLVEGVGMFLSPHALESQNCIERTQLGIVCDAFNGNPCTLIVSWYSLINASDEIDQHLLLWAIFSCSTHSLIMWRHIGKDGDDKFCLHNLPNRNRECVAYFLLEKSYMPKH